MFQHKLSRIPLRKKNVLLILVDLLSPSIYFDIRKIKFHHRALLSVMSNILDHWS